MARFRFESQPAFPLSTAALTDPRLRRGSALLVYARGSTGRPVQVHTLAEELALTPATVRAALKHLIRSGWVLDIGDDHLFLDLPLTVKKDGSLREDEYTECCLRYALGMLPIGEPFGKVGTPEQRRSTFQLISGGERTEKN